MSESHGFTIGGVYSGPLKAKCEKCGGVAGVFGPFTDQGIKIEHRCENAVCGHVKDCGYASGPPVCLIGERIDLAEVNKMREEILNTRKPCTIPGCEIHREEWDNGEEE